MTTYKWKLIDFYDKIHKSGQFQASTLSSAKTKATKASGIFSRIWSNWYETPKNWCRDNDILGTMTAHGLRMLVLEDSQSSK